MRLSSLLLLPLLSSLASAASQICLSSPQIYLHPTPHSGRPSTSSPPTLTEEQAQAVIGHHLGASKHHTLPGLGDWTKLLGVGHGVVGGKTGGEKARVLVVQGVEYAEDFAPSSTQPTFILDPLASTSEFLSPFLHKASTFLSHALKSLKHAQLPKFLLDIFDLLPTEAAHALKQELETLSSWADGLIPTKDDGETFEALELKGLEGVEVGGEEYEAAAGLVKASVASMTASQTPFILILLPPASSANTASERRALPHILGANAANVLESRKKHTKSHSSSFAHTKTRSASASHAPTSSVTAVPHLGNVFSTSLCLTSLEACNNYTSSCGGKGQCGESKRAGKSCWTCSCGVTKVDGADVKWSGVACEKRDVSDIFILIVLTSLLIGAVTIGSIGLLATVGSEPLPSVLTAGGVPGKKD